MVIDPTAIISSLCDLEPSIKGSRVEIGANSRIDSFVKFKPAGGTGDIVIGSWVYLNSGTTIYSGNGVTIGDNTLVAANCTLAATNHQFNDRDTPIRLQGFQPSRGGISIGSDVWIGANCVVLDGAVIGDGAIVAAGSVVRGKLESFGIYAGNPIKQIGSRGG